MKEQDLETKWTSGGHGQSIGLPSGLSGESCSPIHTTSTLGKISNEFSNESLSFQCKKSLMALIYCLRTNCICRVSLKSSFIKFIVWVESNWNSFDLFQKYAIRLIQKGKIYSKNSMKLNSNSIRSIRLQLIYRMLSNFQKMDSFEICSIRFENLQFD